MLLTNVSAFANNDNPVELGKVNWGRDFDKGLSNAKKVEKPVFLLFQEVPGCSTCRNYGQNVLSHPLIVEAIETLFIPVAIFNNKGGADAKVLKYYGEPSWNNPVVRIVNPNKQNLVDRVSGNYTQLGIVQAMVMALQAEENEVPAYLSLLEQELLAEKSGTETTVFSMFCFWTGEKEIGKLDGVVETQAGFMNGREVVSVKYDPEVITYKKLLTEANQASCANHVYTEDKEQEAATADLIGKNKVADLGTFRQDREPKYYFGKNKVADLGTFRQDREPKYYLGKTVYRFVPMTQLQAVKVNSLIGQRELPDILLSPRQLELLKSIQANPNGPWKNSINKDFVKAWEEIAEKA